MQIFKKIEDFKKSGKPLVIAVGNFDGVHLGHQKILKRVTESAVALKATPAVFTFQEHPQKTLKPGLPPPEIITSQDFKMRLLERAGIEIVFAVSFDEKFSRIEAEDFVRKVLIEKLDVKKLCLGYNAHFGFERKGNPAFMKKNAAAFGIEFEEIGPVEIAGEVVSSSRIRKLLREGNLSEIEKCLGRPYGILGKVVEGDGRGKTLGFPTANLELSVPVILPYGVYAAEVREAETAKNVWKGVLNYGLRPTFGKTPQPVLEIHILDFAGSLYGHTLEVLLKQQLRPEMKFQGPEALKEQISADISKARALWKA